MAEIERDAHIASPDSLCNPHNVSEPGQVKAIVRIERDAKVGSSGEIGDSIDRLDRPLFCSAASVIPLNGDPYDSSPPFQRLDRGFHPWLIFDLAIADVHSQPKKEQLEMRLVQGSQPLGDLLRMIEDGSRKSILARKSGLLLGTDIAKLVRKDGVWQAAGAPPSNPLASKFASAMQAGCGTLDKPPATRQHHAAPLLYCVAYLPALATVHLDSGTIFSRGRRDSWRVFDIEHSVDAALNSARKEMAAYWRLKDPAGAQAMQAVPEAESALMQAITALKDISGSVPDNPWQR